MSGSHFGGCFESLRRGLAIRKGVAECLGAEEPAAMPCDVGFLCEVLGCSHKDTMRFAAPLPGVVR